MADKLEKLEEELYGKEGGDELKRRMKKRIFFPPSLKEIPARWTNNKKISIEDGFNRRAIKFFIAGIAILFAVGGSILIFLYLGTKGTEASIEIKSEERVTAGEVMTIPIVFHNVSRVTLKEMELAIILPPGSLVGDNGIFHPAPTRLIKKYDDLPAGQEGIVEISVRLFGQEGQDQRIGASLLYRPENLRARFSAKTEKNITISRVPLAISWEVPETFIQGQEILVKIHYISQAPTPFDNLSLRLEYPPGFIVSLQDPKPTVGDAIWIIGTLDPGKEGLITLKGTLQGIESESKTFRAGLGIFDPLTKEWTPYLDSSQGIKIVVAPLSVAGFVGGARERIITPGERLNFSLKFKNNTRFTIKNVSVRAFPDGSILDLATLSVDQRGVYDGGTNSIIWSPGNFSDFREIGPGAEGVLTFNIGTRSRPKVGGPHDKNLVIKLRSIIGSATPPQEFEGNKLESEDVIVLKVKSKIILAGRSLYRSSPVLNSGPLPPRVGEKTSYTILWEARNFTNDLKNAEVKATLPANVKWENVIFPKDSQVRFNQAAGEVRWFIGNLAAGTGIFVPALTAAFQVSVVPGEADIGKAITLLNESRLSGSDSFIGEDVSEITGPLSTELREDPTTANKDWLVAP